VPNKLQFVRLSNFLKLMLVNLQNVKN